MDTRSNTARHYQTQFDAVTAIFENPNSEEFEFSEPCLQLLEDPHLPLKYRVYCYYMYAHASDEPEKEIEKALDIVKVIESRFPDPITWPTWLPVIKVELERILPGMKQIAEEMNKMSSEELESELRESSNKSLISIPEHVTTLAGSLTLSISQERVASDTVIKFRARKHARSVSSDQEDAKLHDDEAKLLPSMSEMLSVKQYRSDPEQDTQDNPTLIGSDDTLIGEIIKRRKLGENDPLDSDGESPSQSK